MRRMSPDTQAKVSDELTKFGVEPRIEVNQDAVTWKVYNDDLRECTIFGVIPVRFSSDDAGKSWRGAFPMLGVTNQSGSKVQTVGYLTEKAGDFKSRVDHLSISLGRQLFDLGELVTSTDVADTSVAALKTENAQLQSAHRQATVAATVMEIVYQGESGDGQTEVTIEMWDLLPLKLQQKIASNPATSSHVPDGAKYSDGTEIELAASPSGRRK